MHALSREAVSGLVQPMEGDGFRDTLNCRKKNALGQKTPHLGVQDAQHAPSLCSLWGWTPQNIEKLLRDFHPLGDILIPGLSRNVSL